MQRLNRLGTENFRRDTGCCAFDFSAPGNCLLAQHHNTTHIPLMRTMTHPKLWMTSRRAGISGRCAIASTTVCATRHPSRTQRAAPAPPTGACGRSSQASGRSAFLGAAGWVNLFAGGEQGEERRASGHMDTAPSGAAGSFRRCCLAVQIRPGDRDDRHHQLAPPLTWASGAGNASIWGARVGCRGRSRLGLPAAAGLAEDPRRHPARSETPPDGLPSRLTTCD